MEPCRILKGREKNGRENDICKRCGTAKQQKDEKWAKQNSLFQCFHRYYRMEVENWKCDECFIYFCFLSGRFFVKTKRDVFIWGIWLVSGPAV